MRWENITTGPAQCLATSMCSINVRSSPPYTSLQPQEHFAKSLESWSYPINVEHMNQCNKRECSAAFLRSMRAFQSFSFSCLHFWVCGPINILLFPVSEAEARPWCLGGVALCHSVINPEMSDTALRNTLDKTITTVRPTLKPVS